MAEQDREQKTEEPTPKRLNKAREDGQVARSQDLSFGSMLLATAGILLLFGDGFLHAYDRVLFSSLDSLTSASERDVTLLGQLLIRESLSALAPFFALLIPVVVLVGFLQVGLHLVPAKLRLRPEKLKPNFSPNKFVNIRSLIETATSVLKFVFLAAAYVFAVWDDIEALMATDSRDALVDMGVTLVVRLLIYIGLTMVVIGVIDFALRRWNTKKELRMTKDEVRQEAKDAMGDPHVKGRIRSRQRQIALQRMMDEVPKASVVVTNPTHFAVALRYEPGMPAPKVVAKGADFVALRIREIAREAGVPIIENPPLARALHDTARPGDEIPPDLYQAVAELLAAVMKTRRRVGSRA